MFIAGNEPDLILISEILPKAHNAFVSKPQLALPGFSVFFNFDPDDQSSYSSGIRGVAIYVADKFAVSEVNFSDCNLSDCICVSLRLRGHDSLLIGCLYRSPSSPLLPSSEHICQVLRKASTYSHLLFCGDFNYPSIDWSNGPIVSSSSQPIQLFLDTLNDLFLYQHVTDPTRYRAGGSPHVLDLVLTNEEDMVRDITYHPGLGLSDHVCICFTVVCYSNYISSDKLRFNLHRANFDGMRESLSAVDWCHEISSLNINDAWNFFYDVFDNVIKSNIPVSHATCKRNIYMTREAMQLKNTKYRLWRKYCSTHAQADRSFVNLSTDMLPILYKSLVRPLLEYGNLIWGPFYILDQRLVENVQRRATRLVPGIGHLSYIDRLRTLNIPSLAYRRKRGDMLLLYQMFQGHIDLSISDFFALARYSSTRGHSRKIFKSRFSCRARSTFFSTRVISDWNSLPDYVVNAPSISSFKEQLDHHWTSFMYSNDF